MPPARSLPVRLDHDLDPPVRLLPRDLGFEGWGIGAVDRLRLHDRPRAAEALRLNALRRDVHVCDEPDSHGFRAPFAERLIVSRIAERIGVAFDAERGLGIALDQLAELLKLLDRLGL